MASKKLPRQIARAFQKLKAESKDHLVLKMINNKYYVYKEHGIWLKKEHKNKTISEYLGRINTDGIYIKKLQSAKSDLQNAINLIKDRGGQVLWPDEVNTPSQTKQTHTISQMDEINLKLLTALSMNSRISIPKISKIAGISKQNAYSRIRKLEKELNVKHILEIDLIKLGYIPYIAFIKFEDTIPPAEELKTIFGEQPRIQFAATMKGIFDLMLYFIVTDPLNAFDYIWSVFTQTPLKKYKATWSYEPFPEVYSFMPLRNDFFEKILNEREWHRTKKSARPLESELLHRELAVLRELNKESTKSFNDIDKKNGLNRGSAYYAYNALVNKGIIKRPTITMRNLPMAYVGILRETVLSGSITDKFRYKPLFDIIEHGPITSKYALVANLGNPFGSIFFLPVTEGEMLEATARYLESETRGIVMRTSIISSILVGELCYRRFDKQYTRQYQLLLDRGEIDYKPLTNYS